MSYTTCKCIAFSLFVIAFLLSASSIVLIDDPRLADLETQESPAPDRYALTTAQEPDIQLQMPLDMPTGDMGKPD